MHCLKPGRYLAVLSLVLGVGCAQPYRYFASRAKPTQTECITSCQGDAPCLRKCSGVVRDRGTCQPLNGADLVCAETSERPRNAGLRAGIVIVGVTAAIVGLVFAVDKLGDAFSPFELEFESSSR